MLLSPRNKGVKSTLPSQNHSQIFNKSCKQIIRKSTQEQYEDLFKTLSGNYFQKTAVGALVHKQVKDVIKPRSFRQVCNQNQNFTRNLEPVQQFNSSKQISKLLKIGDVFECNQLKRKVASQNDQDTKNNEENQKKGNNQILGQKQTPSTNKSNNMTRPATSGTCRKFQRYLSAKNKRNSKAEFKFVRIEGKNETIALKKLKKSVDDLQNIAITKYGVEFKCYDKNPPLKYQQNTNIRIQQMRKKLKQIRNSREEQEKQEAQDSTIPKDFMKFLCGSKKYSTGFYNMAKRSSSHIYLKVF